MDAPLPLGVRFLRAVTSRAPLFSIADMDERTLARVQATDLPSGPLVHALLGRPRRDVRIRLWSFAGPGGRIPVRVYTPLAPSRRPRPLVLGLHGGGFALGSAQQGDWFNTRVAAGVGAVVVAPNYRLAPTHRFPAAVDDAWAALQWAVANEGEFKADASRLAVMGDSAGGTLAAVLALMARDAGGPRIRHQALLYPAADMTDAMLEQESAVRNTAPIVLSNEDLRVFRDHYVAAGTDLTDWRLSPAHARDHGGLPPATVVLAGRDPLRDSGASYAHTLADAGVEVRVEEFHRMPHGFLTFPYLCRDAVPATRAVVAALDAALNG